MKTKNKATSAAVVIFLVLMALPLIQTFFKLLPEAKLNGFVETTLKPGFNTEDWFSGKMQDEIQSWIDQNLGFRGYLIKTDNYINYILFRELHQKTSNKIIIGKQNYLFEEGYIQTYLGQDYQPLDKLEQRVQDLKKMQDILTDHGIVTIMLISPSKASFYHEYIPPELIFDTSKPNPQTNYEQIIPLLEKYQVSYFDGREMMLNLKDSAKYPLFPKSGTHWTRYGSCLVLEEILRRVGAKQGKDLKMPDCDNVYINPTPQFEDKDLTELTNLWNAKIFYQPLAYPQFKDTPPKPNDINLLMVGDSFGWGLLKNINDGQFVKNYNFYYYFNSDYRPDYSIKPINRNDFASLKRDILKNNVVIVEANESSLGDIGFGFIAAAISAMEKKD